MTTRRRKDKIAQFVSEEMPTAAKQEVRTTPIRVTVDLAPADHKALKRWCNGAALDLDLTSVALSQALRALAAELTAEAAERLPGLDERIHARLRDT